MIAYMAAMLGLFIVGLAIAFGAQAHRDYLGTSTGNLILAAEIVVAALVAGVVTLNRRGKRNASVAVGLLTVSLIFGMAGWFVHPDQVMTRAEDRVDDWTESLERFHLEQQYGEKLADSAIRYRRYETEISARRSELMAAQMRYVGDPDFYRSSIVTWIFSALAGICAFAALVFLRRVRINNVSK